MYITRRAKHNPIISPLPERGWEAQGSFNASPVIVGNLTYVLYRAQGRPDPLMSPTGISTIARAVSIDGTHFQNRTQFIVPEKEWERYGCEDPRVTYFEGQYITFYTALGGFPFGPGNIKVAVALSKDLGTVTEKHLVTPFNAKAMALFPERINGKITVIVTAHTDEPPARIAIAQCDRLEELWDFSFWEKWHANFDSHCINPLRSENDHVEVGAVPIKTKEGWLLFYSYIQNYFKGSERVFGIEALLLDLKNPLRITAKTNGPLLVPEEIYERFGIVPNVIFPSGAVLHKNNRIDLYYGAADTVCARASLNLPDLLSAMLPEQRKGLALRVKENPILKPIPTHSWESRAVFNAASFELDGNIYILYRAMGDDDTSVIGLAITKNGIKINERLPEPVYVPREDFEKKSHPGNSGCEDPRVTVIGNTIYMAYTAYDGNHATRVALTSISTKDFLARKWTKWQKPVLTTPDNINDKDTCLLPEKITGKYMFMHRIDPLMCADFLDSLDFSKNRLTRCIEIMGPRAGMWDSVKIGIAGPPIKTDIGWLLIYHGVSRTSTYRLGAALLDLKNPSIVLSRTVDPILEPLETYETEGVIPRAVFSCGAVLRGDTLFVYYGGADTVLCVAKISLKKLIKILAPNNLE